jgi:hypothetical protein
MTTPEADALRHFLGAQRGSALAILDGLTEEQLRTPVLPSGWTPLGLVKHLGDAERHWFQQVFLGRAQAAPWADGEEPLVSGRPVAEVFAYYREQCAVGDTVLAATPLDTPPAGRHGDWLDDEITDLRRVVLHLIEETARHLGHLDAARELLDGRTGLGPR